MVNRRSLGDALSITPEKMAFIQGGKTTAEPQKAAAPVTATPAAMKETEAAVEPEERHQVVESEKATRTARRARGRSRSKEESHSDEVLYGMANLMVPITTRLQPATAAALKRAGLEQKLRGAYPPTVQEIVEIAISDWLEEHGYL